MRMNARPPAPGSMRVQSSPPREPFVPDILGLPTRQPGGIWGLWLWITVPSPIAGLEPSRQRERLRRARLLSALQLTAFVLAAILLPRGFLPVIDPGTLIGIAGFMVLVVISMVMNRMGHVATASWIFVVGLAVAIAGSQLFTPTGTITFEDLAGYDFLVIPILITGFLLPRAASVYLWLGCVIFIILDLGLAEHGPSLDKYLPKTSSPFLSIYPVAVYPLILTAIVAVISWLAAGSVASALQEADRTSELERAYRLLAEQKAELEAAIATLQQVHSRVANGDLSARAVTTSGQLLLPLAISLNLMLERLGHMIAAQSTLGEQESRIARLGQYTAMLAQGRFDQPIPQQNMGNLTTLALHLEQMRLGITQIAQYIGATVGQIDEQQQGALAQIQQIGQQPQMADQVMPEIYQTLEAGQRLARTLQHYLRQYMAV
jgi:hypothetical protein